MITLPFASLLRTLTRLGCALAFCTLPAGIVQAADVLLAPSSGSYAPGQTFTVSVQADPSGTDVNAVEAALSFNPDVLSVVSLDQDASIFSLWTEEPTFSNSAGTISFSGGSPSPFSSTETVLAITFRTVAAGSGAVSVDSALVLAADGQGTNVFEDGRGGTYTVAANASDPQPQPVSQPEPQPEAESTDEESDDAIIFGDPPQVPEVGSQAFLDPTVWYNTTEGMFTWTLPFDVDAVAVEIASSSDNVPQENSDAIIEPPVEEFAISSDNVTDGEQYLSINFRNQVGWGATLNRKVQIDTTPPEPFAIEVRPGTEPGDFPLLKFEASDETSGIDFYELTIADREPVTVTPDEARETGYLVTKLEDGTYTATIVAHDRAGNTRKATTPVLVEAGWTEPDEDAEASTFWDFLTPQNGLIAFLLIVIILQFIYMWYERKTLHLREEKLRRETREVQDQMEKIFSALRDEIYDQVNTITKRKRLSQKEREAVEGLTQALEVSETLIEKEVNDVKSILK